MMFSTRQSFFIANMSEIKGVFYLASVNTRKCWLLQPCQYYWISVLNCIFFFLVLFLLKVWFDRSNKYSKSIIESNKETESMKKRAWQMFLLCKKKMHWDRQILTLNLCVIYMYKKSWLCKFMVSAVIQNDIILFVIVCYCSITLLWLMIDSALFFMILLLYYTHFQYIL